MGAVFTASLILNYGVKNMLHRILRSSANLATTDIEEVLDVTTPTARVDVHSADEVRVYRKADPNNSIPAELNDLLLDTGWVIAGQKAKIPKHAGAPALTIPRLSIARAPGTNPHPMGHLRLPKQITDELGWKPKDKIVVMQNTANIAFKNTILLVKSNSRTGYALTPFKKQHAGSSFIRFLWAFPNTELTKPKTYYECTYEIKDKQILCLKFNPDDLKEDHLLWV
jgi:hypothetical protein